MHNKISDFGLVWKHHSDNPRYLQSTTIYYRRFCLLTPSVPLLWNLHWPRPLSRYIQISFHSAIYRRSLKLQQYSLIDRNMIMRSSPSAAEFHSYFYYLRLTSPFIGFMRHTLPGAYSAVTCRERVFYTGSQTYFLDHTRTWRAFLGE